MLPGLMNPFVGRGRVLPALTSTLTDAFVPISPEDGTKTSRTATGRAIGTAAANRVVVVVARCDMPTSLTIGGVAATLSTVGIFTIGMARIASGATADLEFTWAVGSMCPHVGIFAVYGEVQNLTPKNSAQAGTNNSTSVSATLNSVPYNGVVLGMFYEGGATSTPVSSSVSAGWTSSAILDSGAQNFIGRFYRENSANTTGSASLTQTWTTSQFQNNLWLFSIR